MNEKVLQEVRRALCDAADEKTCAGSERFFKEGERAVVYGVKSADVRRIGKTFYAQIKPLPKHEIFALCDALFTSGFLEEKCVACLWAEAQHKRFESADFAVFARWVETYVSNWAECDTLCNHTVGTFVMMFPEYVTELKKWAASPNRWVKRAAAVTLIIPARKGLFLLDIFDIADALLLDTDDMVQKGYGWMLKAASEAHQQEVFDYVMSKRAVMPRTALRYAIEKMPKELKTRAMSK